MQPFLKTIAGAYMERFGDLSEICFVFPNKRSGTFFMKYLSGHADKPTLSPEITSITDFVARLSRRVPGSRFDMLFRLYNVYKDFLRRNGVDSDVEFEGFRIWGETVLSDFSEVDQYMVDAEMIFKNVKDFREISSTFLTEDQKRVIKDYFGKEIVDDPSVFWKNMHRNGDESALRSRFLKLWESLLPLYEAFTADMDAAGMATSGRCYRLAAENVEEADAAGGDMLPWRKVVFVGFNALSTAEHALFRALSRLRTLMPDDPSSAYADFLWDGTGPVLDSDGNTASTFLRANRRDFPSPEWLTPYVERSAARCMPEVMDVVGSPSNSAQAKLVGVQVGELVDRLGADALAEARVAVVLPDESLLLPLLYSLPANLQDVNLTMGYSLKLTSAYSFVSLLRRLQSRVKREEGGNGSAEDYGYFHEDVSVFLSHPFSHALLGMEGISKLKSYMREYHKYVVTAREIMDFCPDAACVVRQLRRDTPVPEVIGYIDNILSEVEKRLQAPDDAVLKTRLDLAHIDVFRRALTILRDSTEEHHVRMGVREVFAMVCRLVGAEKVSFEGEPLRGLQVMGLLETRSLDFDYLIIPSMNEGFMPRRMRKRTFIPNTLRGGYGMPPANYQENVFAYYFYRLISRCREARMLYDATGGNKGRGDISRYLLQLKYLYSGGSPLKFTYPRFRLARMASDSIEVEKTEEVMGLLQEYTQEGTKRNFSASSIEKYIACPVRFYFETLQGLKAEVHPEGVMDSSTQGSIVHSMLEDAYLPRRLQGKFLDAPVLITKEHIGRLLNEPGLLEGMLRRKVNETYNRLEADRLDTQLYGSTAIIARRMLDNVRKVLAYDLEHAPFYIAGTEITGLRRWRMPDGRSVNVRYVVDRVDIVGCREGDPSSGTMRIVDYKTGKADVAADSLEDVFKGESEGMQLVQLMLYAMMMAEDHGIERSIALRIYSTRNEEGKLEVAPSIAKREVSDYHQLKEEYAQCLNALLTEIFSDAIPFRQTGNTKACRYCGLRDLCNRE